MDNDKFVFPKLGSLPPLDDSSNKLKNNSKELPSFDSEDEKLSFDDTLEIPKPPKELKSRDEYKRLQELEDEYLETNVSDSESSNSLNELKELSRKDPIFVNLEDYASLIETVKSSKQNFKIFQEKFENLDAIKNAKESELEKLNKILENLQRRIIAVDNHLFEKEEE